MKKEPPRPPVIPLPPRPARAQHRAGPSGLPTALRQTGAAGQPAARNAGASGKAPFWQWVDWRDRIGWICLVLGLLCGAGAVYYLLQALVWL